ncbi:hypothetical protein D3C77_738160 [compost metagenome]
MPTPREDHISTVPGLMPVCMVSDSHLCSSLASSSGRMESSTLVRICCNMGSCWRTAMAMGTLSSLPEKTT